MGVRVPSMAYTTSARLSRKQMERLKAEFSAASGRAIVAGDDRRRSCPQCCPNCGAPATRNILHCEYCRTRFNDATPGIDIYALCDSDPERIDCTTLADPQRRYLPAMQDETFRK